MHALSADPMFIGAPGSVDTRSPRGVRAPCFRCPAVHFLLLLLLLLLLAVVWMVAKPLMTLLVVEPMTAKMQDIASGVVVAVPCGMTIAIFTMGHTT